MAATPQLTLWGVGTSRMVHPHWAMHELDLPYTTRPIGPLTGETKTAEYTALNQRQKVPLLQDGDFCIGESAAIVAYSSAASIRASGCTALGSSTSSSVSGGAEVCGRLAAVRRVEMNVLRKTLSRYPRSSSDRRSRGLRSTRANVS